MPDGNLAPKDGQVNGAGYTVTTPPAPVARPSSPANGAGPGKPPPQRDRIIETALDAGISFWRDADGTAFASVPRGGHTERYRVRSAAFRMLLRALYAEAHPSITAGGKELPGSVTDNAMRDALAALEAKAFSGEVKVVAVRLLADGDPVRGDGALWLDLGDPQWRSVKITRDGWNLVDCADIALVRPEGMRALPVPARDERGTVLNRLRVLLNPASDDDFRLMISWLVAALFHRGPFPVLAVDGEQGSGKSSVTRFLRKLVDPNLADHRAAPKSEDDLLIAAQNGRVVAIDNLSYVEPDMADALCRLATGAGFSKRRLYTDGDEVIVHVSRPILLNGIPSVLGRGDLADRAIALTLPAIPDTKRRPEAAIAEDFEAIAPAVLALLLDAIATALRDLPALNLPGLPRMADFARLAGAAAPAFGWTSADILRAMSANRAAAVDGVLEADAVGSAVRALSLPWRGTPTELLDVLGHVISDEVRRDRGWPRDAARLSSRLTRIAPALRRVGIEITNTREGAGRTRTIAISASAASVTSWDLYSTNNSNGLQDADADAAPDAASSALSAADAIKDDADAGPQSSVRDNPLENMKKDAADAADAVFLTLRALDGASERVPWEVDL